MDAVLVSGCIRSFVSLSQSPVFRREWSSAYAALKDSRLPQAKILELLVSQIPTDEQPVLAGDVGRWYRPEAKTLQDCTFYRCVYGVPPAYKGQGTPAKHGHKMKLNDVETWSVPSFYPSLSRIIF